MAICDLIIAIPVQGLIKQINQMILYSWMMNYDKLPTDRAPRHQSLLIKILLYIQNRQELQKDTVSSQEIPESPWIKSLQ